VSGVALGAVAGIGFGLFQVVNRRVNEVADVYVATFGLMAVSTAVLVAISALTGDPGRLRGAPPFALLAFASAGFVHFFLGWTFLGLSQQRLGAARTGALMGSMPLIGAVLVIVLLGETLTLRTLVALLVVVAGVVAISLRPRGAPGGPRTVSLPGLGFGLATALCWSLSPVLIRVGLDRFGSPILGVTVGIATTTLVYGVVVAVVRRRRAGMPEPAPLGPLVLAGTLVALSIWGQWSAFQIAPIGIVLAVLQLSVPVVALVSPLVSHDPLERGGVLLWVGVVCVVSGALTFLLRG
jgi:drug/metabolite transporter (DMT)-like permease